MMDIDHRKAAQHRRRQHSRRRLLSPGRLLQRFHRFVRRPHAQGLRQDRRRTPGHHRIGAALDLVPQNGADPPPDLVHVGMRIGFVTDDRIGVLDHRGGAICVHVQGHRQRQVGCDFPHPAQQLALSVGNMLGRHRPVQVEEHRIDSACAQRCQDPFAELLVGFLLDQPTWHRLGNQRADDLGTMLVRQIEIGRHRHRGPAVGGKRGLVTVEPPALESRHAGGHRRERVGLVFHHCRENAHRRSPRAGPPQPEDVGRLQAVAEPRQHCQIRWRISAHCRPLLSSVNTAKVANRENSQSG